MFLEVRDLNFSYDNSGSPHLLEGINFSLEKHEAISIIGPSGCGKSTLLKIICGLLKANSGAVLKENKAIKGADTQTSYVSSEFGLLPWYSVYKNVELPLKLHGVDATQRKEKVNLALEKVELKKYSKKFPKELSMGQKQRACIAKAIAVDTNLMLCDEPLCHVDDINRINLQDIFLESQIANKYAQILITHNIDEALKLSSRVLVFSEKPSTIIYELDNSNHLDKDYLFSQDFIIKRQLLQQKLKDALACNKEGLQK
ncbi:MAG: ATP-binding cassette domain-containing protein [Coriobacteriales bacterium]|nr:ATP-binding cassette domain-containing protein [Coriobacteriales bacterium]